MNLAVIFAGGVGTRMRSRDLPKQFLKLHGKPVIVYTLEHFEIHPEIDGIVVACVAEWMDYLRDLIKKYNITKVKKIVPGGKNSQESIFHGLEAAEQIAGEEKSVVLIHDGVRPLITAKTISDNIACVKEFGACITSVKVKETVMIVSGDNSIDYITDRPHSRLARAPQSFWLDEILAAHRKALSDNIDNFIDCCSMMHHYGKQLYLIDGPEENIKITTPDDFYIMRAMLDAKENAQIYGLEE